jgi:LysM repeat protein
MSKKYIWIFTLALVAVFILAACERSAVAPESTPVGDSGGLTTVSLPDAYKTQTTSGAYTALALTMQPGAPLATGSTPTSTRYWDPTTTPTTSGLLPTLTGTVVVIVPTPTIGVPDSYKLQKGEYPYCIARRFNVDIGELLSLNGLRETDLFEEGLVLKIPKTGNSFIGSRTLIPTTYSAVMGDTVYRIACAFGDVDPIYLAAYNGLVAPYTLTTGTLLNIP